MLFRSVVPSASAVINNSYKAASAITAGQVVYVLAGTQTVGLSDALTAAPVNTVLGIAVNNAATGQPVAVCTSDPALAIGATVASGVPYFMSGNNAGGIAPFADLATGWKDVCLGIGVSTSAIALNPIIGGTHA